ncbi:hypothetical protein BASA81_000165 [Batrachochytrium salamandrivorans]|nr:hypothetical protein BASA81_000165 [Batrachochytrium salamandrivorans]
MGFFTTLQFALLILLAYLLLLYSNTAWKQTQVRSHLQLDTAEQRDMNNAILSVFNKCCSGCDLAQFGTWLSRQKSLRLCMQLPRSWFKITSKACVRRPSRAQASEDGRRGGGGRRKVTFTFRVESSSLLKRCGSTLILQTRTASTRAQPPFPTSTPSPMQLVSDEDFKLLSATVAPCSAYNTTIRQNYFGLTHREYALLERPNDPSANSFLLHAAVGYCTCQSTQQRTQRLQSELGPFLLSTSASLEGLRKSLLFPADNESVGKGAGELDPNWRQSTLDFERDRVVVNSSEVLPCVMSEIIAKMAREIGQIANESGDASSHHLKFIWTILLAANRTQCGGVIYETLQQMFRSTPAMQDQFLISPKSEQVLPLNITLGRAYSELSTSMEPLQLPPLPSPRSGSELETTTMVKSASDSLPPKRGHRRSSSDPQFFKKMMPKYPQPVQTTNLTRTSSLSPSLGQPQQPPVALDSPKKSPLTMGRRLPPPPASASAYFKHQRTFSLQKKHHHPAELEFQHFDALPGNSVRACVVATMDFVVRDCDTNEPVLCVQCVYTREFFLVDGKSLAKDQGQVSVCLLEEEEEVGGEAEEEVVGEDKLNLTSLVTEVDEEDDCGSVVFLSGEEEEEEEELEEVL